MYSFSTSWNADRHTDGRHLMHEIRQLGFDHAELSHNTRISLIPGVLDAVAAGEIKISSLHNFCPLPIGADPAAPDTFKLSDPRPQYRALAVQHTKKTIELAARLHAPVVVLHLGTLGIKDYTRRLVKLADRGLRATPAFLRVCAAAHRALHRNASAAMRLVHESLKELLPHARAHGVRLAAENREALELLPTDDDLPSLFEVFPDLGYWHDTGHAQIKENLGLLHNAFQLELLRDRLVGLHIHDVQYPARDHCQPGTGTVDFAALKRV
ncbi:MAG: sugar phosphate isomerase/epimerase, partial [Verrucomicrobiales bacterium]|nr:sugar phosphate isomerase/epimerase [Verrucomicrobiales bacterium]